MLSKFLRLITAPHCLQGQSDRASDAPFCIFSDSKLNSPYNLVVPFYLTAYKSFHVCAAGRAYVPQEGFEHYIPSLLTQIIPPHQKDQCLILLHAT